MGESILHWEDGQPWGKTNSVAAACISDMAGVDKRNRMARRSGGLECSPITLLSDPGVPGSDLWVRMSVTN